MAPSQVFSYFRTHHRKQNSTPTSPNNSNPPSAPFPPPFDPLPPPPPPNPAAVESPSSASPISPLPPTLPSIRRVSSYRYTDTLQRPLPQAAPSAHDVSRQQREDSGHYQEPESATASYRHNQNASISPAPPRTPQTRQGNAQPLGAPFQTPKEISRRPVTSASNHSYNESQSRNHLAPPTASSPTSSYSSLPKSTSSTNLTTDTSPASSRSTPVPSVPPRAGKSKINLLNPVSLLMRRRTAQGSSSENEKIPVFNQMDVPAMNLPKDYDPRIRGKVVHDFSAPRPKRDPSITDLGTAPPQNADITNDEHGRTGSTGTASETEKAGSNDAVKTPEKEHTPVFTEHFDDDDLPSQDHNAAVHRESLANSTFLARISRQLDQEIQEPPPSSSKRTSEQQPQQIQHPDAPSTAGERTSRGTDVPSFRASSDQSTARSSFSNDTKATSPPQSPTSQTPSRASLSLEPPFQPSGLRSHLPSNASRSSRFSFQLNSDRSVAQEKALEEKHKQKFPKPIKSESLVESVYEETDEDDMSDYDMDDDGLEEAIPGVNADASDDELAQFNQNLRDTHLEESLEGAPVDEPQTVSTANMMDSYYDTPTDEQFEPDPDFVNSSMPLRGNTKTSTYTDDMYFDDGLIEEPATAERENFDEALLDSPHKSTRERRTVENAMHHPGPMFPRDSVDDLDDDSVATGPSSGVQEEKSTQDDQATAGQMEPAGFDATQSNIKPHRISIPSNNGVSDYQRALASAARRAEAAGKFRRNDSVESASGTAGSSIYDDEHAAQDFSGGFIPDNDDEPPWSWNDEEDVDDDPMVAAANAEALAADESGFYGTEFGFYGNGGNGDEAWNGGFFGAPGGGLGRSMSGHNASREPNLTPITERSEFSTRNSFISLHAYGGPYSGSNASIPIGSREQSGPGLKELAAGTFDEDELTLSQLMKLRKEAFGGRSASAGASASSSPSTSFSSPLAMNSYNVIVPPETETVLEEREPTGPDDGHQRAASHGEPLTSGSLSTPGPVTAPSSFSPDTTPRPPRKYSQSGDEFVGKPTQAPPSSYIPPPLGQVPMPSADLVHKFAARPPASSESFAARQVQAHQQRSRHQRNSHGGSDSVTYVREEDKAGGTMWFLERRRRMSTGEVVVVGRELVEGGRI